MPRRVRYHDAFRRDLGARAHWLAAHRRLEERQALRVAVGAFVRRVAMHPGLGVEVDQRGAQSYRVVPIGGRLPYLVWYGYDIVDERGPVSLLMLLHDLQDRERFDPTSYE